MGQKPKLPPNLKLPFKVNHKLPFDPLRPKKLKKDPGVEEKKEVEARLQAWLDSIKQQARDNIKNDFEYIRIAWHNRWGIPKHPHFNDYTQEEAILESWEQFYFDNPDSLEMKGIIKKQDPNTGYKYYQTGDPVIDELEKVFASGGIPDLEKAFGHIKNGESIWKHPVFQGGKHVPSEPTPKVVKKNEKGEKITEAGTKLEHDNFKSDDWVKEALQNDPVLQSWEQKMKKVTDADV